RASGVLPRLPRGRGVAPRLGGGGARLLVLHDGTPADGGPGVPRAAGHREPAPVRAGEQSGRGQAGGNRAVARQPRERSEAYIAPVQGEPVLTGIYRFSSS